MSLKDELNKLKFNRGGEYCVVNYWQLEQDPELLIEIADEFAKSPTGHWVIYRAVKTLTEIPFSVKTFVCHYRKECKCYRMR